MKHIKDRMYTKHNKTVLTLIALVVFVTTYSLIMPATSLSRQAAEEEPGITLNEFSEEQPDETAGKETVSEEKSELNDKQESFTEEDKMVITDVTEETPDHQPEELSEPVGDDLDSGKETAEAETPIEETEPSPVLSYPAVSFEETIENFVTVKAEAEEGTFPEGTTMVLTPVEQEEVIDTVKETVEGTVKHIVAVDITFKDVNGNEIEPLKQINVTMSAPSIEDTTGTEVVHIDNEGNGTLVEQEESAEDEVIFNTDTFSVYVIAYTVDFHVGDYTYSIQGGGGVSLSELFMLLGIEKNVSDVENVTFSNESLIKVVRITEDATLGQLKEQLGLTPEYSADVTEEQIAEWDGKAFSAPDWVLISLKPFSSSEMLTITMKDGEQFVVTVTDAQDPSVYVDKEVIVYDNGEQRAMISGGYTYDNHYRLNSIPLSEAEGNDAAHWTVERHNNNYYLKSSDNRYLTIDGNNVGLVNNWSVATPLGIQAGGSPDYRIYDANNYNNVLTYYTNNNWGDGFFSAPGARNGSDEQRWLYIKEIETIPDRAGDWLLYFDDDFNEITIHVGETISLRPYNKWEWKEDSRDVQTAHWNIGGRDNNYWNQIDANDANGAHKESWNDGGTGGTAGFHWTAYVKKDDQLTTHYWAVQGQATQTGDYVLTNTKNGKTITVHVVDGDPVNKPNTINKIANIKVNLFDYDNGGELDVGLVNGNTNQNLANNSNFKNESVNQMGGHDHFYFLSSGSGNNSNESWNSYTKDSSNPNIVESTLDENGYPKLNHGNHTSLQYLFDTSQASQSWHGGSGGDGMIAYPDVVGMFQKDPVTGYYYYNSNTNYFYYDTATGTSELYEHTYTQNSSASKGSLANDKPIGFFPFHDYDSTNDLYVNQNAELNHHVGLSMDVEFMLANDRKDDNGQPIIFDFSGDDDLWVFVEWEDDQGVKHSKLMLDLGGVHQPIHGQINFTDDTSIEARRPYTLKVFYLERGGCDSNCSIRFNLPIIQDLAVAKKLTGLTEAEKLNYKDEEFEYELLVNSTPYNYPNPNNRYEKAIVRNAAGEDVTPANFKIDLTVNNFVDRTIADL